MPQQFSDEITARAIEQVKQLTLSVVETDPQLFQVLFAFHTLHGTPESNRFSKLAHLFLNTQQSIEDIYKDATR